MHLLYEFTNFQFRGKVNFDPDGDSFYKSLSQVYLAYSPYGNSRDDFKDFRIMIGKLKSRFSSEHSISPKKLKTFERSLLANQLAPSKTTSLFIGGRSQSLSYGAGVLAGERSTEFGDFEDGGLFLAKLSYEFGGDSRVM